MEQCMKKLNKRRPLAIAGLTAVCAVLLCMLTDVFYAAIAAAVLIIASVVFCFLKRYQTSLFAFLLAASITLPTISFYYHQTCIVAPSMQLLGRTVSIYGTVYDFPKEAPKTYCIPLENCVIDGKKTDLKINLYCTSYDPVQIGDTVSSLHAEIFAAADQDEYYYHTLSGGCWLRAYARYADATGEKTTSFRYKIRAFRQNITNRLLDELGDENGSIAAALLIGDKSFLSDSFKSNIRISGTSHLFAVSGMHLSIWTGVLYFILRKRARNKIIPNIISILFVLFYMGLTGFSPSVLRAGIMMIFIFAGKILRRKSDALNALGISALVLLAGNIYIAGNISFLLSFSATVGILAVYPYFTLYFIGKKHHKIKRSVSAVINALYLSMVALMFTVPFTAFFFGSVSLLSPFSTIVCTVPVQAAMLTSFFGICYGSVPLIGPLIYTLCGMACKTLSGIIQWFSQFYFCVVGVDLRFLLIWYIITAVVLLLVYFALGKNSRKVLITLMVSASLLLSVQICHTFASNNKIQIYIPANGNETCICLHTLDGSFSVLIGTGKDTASVDEMNAYLASNGIVKLNALIIPRISEAENGNTEAYLPIAKSVYSAFLPNDALEDMSDICQADNFTLVMVNGFTYTNRNNEFYSASILQNERIKIVFSFYPGGDMTTADAELLTGDLLICRGNIPDGLDVNNFTSVLVLNEKPSALLGLPPGVFTTAETGDIRLASVLNE